MEDCASKPKYKISINTRETKEIIALPPGEPMVNKKLLFLSKTIKGAIELRGFLPAWGLFGKSFPFISFDLNAKSVSWLFRKKPLTNNLEPNELSILDVTDKTFLYLSTKLK